MKAAWIAIAVFPLAAAAAPPTGPVTVGYRCDAGPAIVVEYPAKISPTGADNVVLMRGVHRWKKSRQPSADGERYTDAKETVEWWSKGPVGRFTELGKKKAVECRERAPKK